KLGFWPNSGNSDVFPVSLILTGTIRYIPLLFIFILEEEPANLADNDADRGILIHQTQRFVCTLLKKAMEQIATILALPEIVAAKKVGDKNTVAKVDKYHIFQIHI
ncbi:hypothetical protein M8C21_002697, partial [Ambrosia artemisiifolia]